MGYGRPTARNGLELLSPARTEKVRGATGRSTEYRLIGAGRTRIAGLKDATHPFWLSCHQRLSSQLCAGLVLALVRAARGLHVAADRPEVRSWPTKPSGRRGRAAWP